MGPGNTGSLVRRTLGEYRLEALLGAGGMAEVYRGQDIALGREVAVKVLPALLAVDPGYVERFREEARRVALLTHPHIVPVYAYGEQDGLLYLVMPVMRESLRDRMTRDPQLLPSDSARLVVQIASALDAAHAQGIVHRDVKPENILLDADGKAHLTDFGIARDMDFLRQTGTNRTLAATGLPVGTPEYMAPEQLRAALVDQRADVYALGAVLYELLTGRAPHEADTPYEVAALSLTAPIVTPSERNPEIWQALDDVVMTALAGNVDDRYPDMRRFAMALRRAVLGKDASIAKLTMPARSLTSIPAVSLAGVGTGELRLRNGGQTAAEWPARPQTGSLGQLPVKPKVAPGGKKFLLIAALVVVALVGIVGGSGLALLKVLGSDGGQANNTVTAGRGGIQIVGTGTDAASTAVSATETAVSVSAVETATAQSAPTPTAAGIATATNTPASSQLIMLSFNVSVGVCSGSQTITNNGSQTIGWSWQSMTPMPANKSSWVIQPIDSNATFSNQLPNDTQPGINPGKTDKLTVMIRNCYHGQSFAVQALDSLGSPYSFTITVQ